MADERPVTVFISYSRQDNEWLDALEVYLRGLERETGILCWSDARIAGGDDWNAEIKRAIAQARVAILLVSARFCASEASRRPEGCGSRAPCRRVVRGTRGKGSPRRHGHTRRSRKPFPNAPCVTDDLRAPLPDLPCLAGEPREVFPDRSCAEAKAAGGHFRALLYVQKGGGHASTGFLYVQERDGQASAGFL